jgi:hypothetical protein
MRDMRALCLFALTGCLASVDGSAGTHAHGNTAVAARDLYGLNVPADGSLLDTAADLNPSWVRVELVDGQPTGDVIAAYHARGIKVLLLVDYSTLGGFPEFTGDQPCGDWGSYRAAWLDRVGQAARTLAPDAWEVWNEPDQPQVACGSDYNPGLPAAEYGALLSDAYALLSPQGVPVVTAGLDSGQVQYVADMGSVAADGISIHPYGVVGDPAWCPDPGEGLNCDFGTIAQKLADYHDATGLPVWITELGIQTTDGAHQADYVTGMYGVLANHPEVAHAFYFGLSDAMVAPFGLTAADGSPKPAYARYQALTSAAAYTSNLHGSVRVGDTPVPGLTVTAWGQSSGDLHTTTTDADGVYQFTDLDPTSLYNIVANAQFDDGFVAIDPAHDYAVDNNVELVAGPDGWHGDELRLSY